MMTRTKIFYSDESGAISVQMMFFTIVFFAIGGLAVDVTNVHRERVVLQATADAAVFAAVRKLDSAVADDDEQDLYKADAVAEAKIYVGLNAPNGSDLVNNSVYTVGKWNPTTRSFSANDMPFNAVKVQITRTKAGQNALDTFFMNFIGRSSWELGATSIAVQATASAPVGCGPGFKTQGGFDKMGSNNIFKKGFCLYAESSKGIDVNSGFQALKGVVLKTKVEGGGTVPEWKIKLIMGSGYVAKDATKVVGTEDLGRAEAIKATINDWIAQEAAAPAGTAQTDFGYTLYKISSGDINGIKNIEVTDSDGNVTKPHPMPNSVYLFSGNLEPSSDFNKSGNFDLTGTILAATGEMKFGSNATIKDTSPKDPITGCNADPTSLPIGLFSGNGIDFGSPSNFNGVDIVTAKTVKIGEAGHGVNLMIESLGSIETGQNSTFIACGGAITLPGGPVTTVIAAGLVQ